MTKTRKIDLLSIAVSCLLFISIAAFGQSVQTSGMRAEAGGTILKPQNNYLNDYAALMSPEDAEHIKSKLRQVEEQTGIEITVVTIKRMADYGFGDIEALARKIFNEWGVGNKKKNDGILVLVAREDRKMAITVGDGWGTSLQSKLQSLIAGEFLPHFKVDRYSVGIREGTDALVSLVTRPLEWYERKWVQVTILFAFLLFFGTLSYSCFKDGKSGWGWVFLTAAFTVLVIIIKILLTPKRGSSSSFGGGFSSGGGGASGSW